MRRPTTSSARLLLPDLNVTTEKALVSAVSATLEVQNLRSVVAVLLTSQGRFNLESGWDNGRQCIRIKIV